MLPPESTDAQCDVCQQRDCVAMLLRRELPERTTTRAETCLGKLLHVPPAALANTHTLGSLRRVSDRGAKQYALGAGTLHAIALALYRYGHTMRDLFIVDFRRMMVGSTVVVSGRLQACALCGEPAWRKSDEHEAVHVVGFDTSTSDSRLVVLHEAPSCTPRPA